MNSIVVEGNPVDGFVFIGPFFNKSEAARYAEEGERWVAALYLPEEAVVEFIHNNCKEVMYGL
jgi:hypothetical protein